ncbi:hypothetical protein D3C72_2245150 [compost metagenome]
MGRLEGLDHRLGDRFIERGIDNEGPRIGAGGAGRKERRAGPGDSRLAEEEENDQENNAHKFIMPWPAGVHKPRARR